MDQWNKHFQSLMGGIAISDPFNGAFVVYTTRIPVIRIVVFVVMIAAFRLRIHNKGVESFN